jgi:hypothetical protein
MILLAGKPQCRRQWSADEFSSRFSQSMIHRAVETAPLSQLRAIDQPLP